jgi:hypothetical protein
MAVPKGKQFVGKASESRVRFFDASDDVRSYYALRQMLKDRKGAQPHLGAASRGFFVLIAAMWEAFCEDLAHEGAQILVQNASTWQDLPRSLKQRISLDLKADAHELSAWRLAGDGWRDFTLQRVTDVARTTTFNTPKAGPIDALFEKALGLKSVSSSWESRWGGVNGPRAELDRAIELRGAIAHGASPAPSVTKKQVSAFYQLTADLAECTETAVGAFIAQQTGQDPWVTREATERLDLEEPSDSVGDSWGRVDGYLAI